MADFFFRHNSTSFEYCSWAQAALERLGVSYQVERDATMPVENFSFLERRGPHPRTIGLDWDDAVFSISPQIVKCDQYLKANYSSEVVAGEDLVGIEAKHFQELREQCRLHAGRIQPWVVGRRVSEAITEPIPPEEKLFFLVTYSGGAGADQHFGKNRVKIYEILRDHFSDASIVVYPGFNGEMLIPLMGNFKSYLQFLSQGYFVLNLTGWLGSNPFRCVDACLSGSCVVSERIFADAYKSFPHFPIPGNTYQDQIDEQGVITALGKLLNDLPTVFGELLPKQQLWWQENLELKRYGEKLLSWFE